MTDNINLCLPFLICIVFCIANIINGIFVKSKYLIYTIIWDFIWLTIIFCLCKNNLVNYAWFVLVLPFVLVIITLLILLCCYKKRDNMTFSKNLQNIPDIEIYNGIYDITKDTS